jgi:serologically defined colon cancer antigen 8
MGEVDAHWKYNVSKKIAQLTRVIFRLHTESLDRHDLVAHVKQKCDLEIAAVVQQATEAINDCQRDAREYRDTLERILREEYEGKCSNHANEYRVVKEQLDSQVKRVVDRSLVQIAGMRKEIEAVRAQADKAKQFFEDASRELERGNHKVIAAMEAKHGQEMEQCVQTANQKYNLLVVESAARENEIRKELLKDIAELKRSAMAESLTTSDSFKRKIVDLEDKNKRLDATVRKQTLTMNNLKTDIERIQKENANLKELAEIERVKHAQQYTEAVSNLQAKFDAELQAKMGEIGHLAKALEKSKGQAELGLEEKSKEFSDLECSLQHQIRELQRKVAESNGINQAQLDQLLADHHQELLAWEVKFSELAHNAELQQTMAHQDILAAQIQHRDEIEMIKTQHEQKLRQRASQLQKLKMAHIQEIDALRAELEARIRDLTEDLEQSRNLYSEATEALATAGQKQKDAIDKLKSDYALTFQELQKKRDLQLQAMASQCEDEIQQLKKRNQEELDDLEQKHQAAMSQLEDSAKVRIRQVEEKGEVELQLAIEKYQSELEQKAAIQFEKMRNTLDREHMALTADIARKSEALEQWRQEWEAQIAEKNDRIYALEGELSTSKANWNEQRLTSIVSHERETEELKQQIELQKAESDSKVKLLQAQIDRLSQESQQGFIELTKKKDVEITQLKEAQEAELAKLQKVIEGLTEALQKLKETETTSVEDHEEQIARADRLHQQVISALKVSHDQQIEALTQRFEEEMQRLREEILHLREQLNSFRERNKQLKTDMESL